MTITLRMTMTAIMLIMYVDNDDTAAAAYDG